MDPFRKAAQRRPPGLRWPDHGDTVSLTIRVDLGPRVPMFRLADCVSDLASVTELGSKWGELLAESAAGWDIANLARRGDRHGLEFLLREELYDLHFEEVHELLYGGPPPYRWLLAGHPVWGLLQAQRAGDIRGQATRPTRLTYENPLELILCGTGALLMGAVMAARLVRDWSSQRRIAAAAATQAEAEARKAEAEADRAETTADFARWMADEAKAGRGGLPQMELLKAITPGEARAIERLAEQDVQLSIPPGFGNSG